MTTVHETPFDQGLEMLVVAADAQQPGPCAGHNKPAALPSLPDVPMLAEQGPPSVDSRAWVRVFALASRPADTVAMLNDAVRKVASIPQFVRAYVIAGLALWIDRSKELRCFP